MHLTTTSLLASENMQFDVVAQSWPLGGSICELKVTACFNRFQTNRGPHLDLMSDKRQRARVQGSWAKPLPKQPRPTGSLPAMQTKLDQGPYSQRDSE